MTFGEKLQKLRKARNLSQEELAAKLSVARQTISKWELDQSTPELGLLAQISDIFGVTTDYLIKETVGEAAEPAVGKQMTKKPSARLTLRLMLGVGGIGTLIFYILSKVFPWECHEDDRVIRGLAGYLAGTETTFLFVLCVLSMIAGLAGLIYLAVQEKKKNA